MTDTYRLKRDSDGNLVPIESVTPTLNTTIKCLPITWGQSKLWDSFGEPVTQWTDEDKVSLINENLVDPELNGGDDLTVELLESNYEAFFIEDLVHGILMASGLSRILRSKGKDGVNIMEELETIET